MVPLEKLVLLKHIKMYPIRNYWVVSTGYDIYLVFFLQDKFKDFSVSNIHPVIDS